MEFEQAQPKGDGLSPGVEAVSIADDDDETLQTFHAVDESMPV